eukprot:29475-Pelagococcus_subviridis.AAC.2
MHADVSAPSDANAGKSPTQHCPLYSLFSEVSSPSAPRTSRVNAAVAMFIARPSIPTAFIALSATPGESGETPPEGRG